MTSECFACKPPRSSARDAAGLPRALCLEHKQQSVSFATGERLFELLDRFEVDFAAPLGAIFNPVFVTIGGETVRAWSDFVAGGVTVYEDCFQVERHAEFAVLLRAGQRPEMKAYLADLVKRPAKDVADALERAGMVRASRELELARQYERGDEVLAKLRAGGWPRDEQDVRRWLKLARQDVPPPDLAFFEWLRRLALWGEVVKAA